QGIEPRSFEMIRHLSGGVAIDEDVGADKDIIILYVSTKQVAISNVKDHFFLAAHIAARKENNQFRALLADACGLECVMEGTRLLRFVEAPAFLDPDDAVFDAADPHCG